jgi:hypothetical protein
MDQRGRAELGGHAELCRRIDADLTSGLSAPFGFRMRRRPALADAGNVKMGQVFGILGTSGNVRNLETLDTYKRTRPLRLNDAKKRVPDFAGIFDIFDTYKKGSGTEHHEVEHPRGPARAFVQHHEHATRGRLYALYTPIKGPGHLLVNVSVRRPNLTEYNGELTARTRALPL